MIKRNENETDDILLFDLLTESEIKQESGP